MATNQCTQNFLVYTIGQSLTSLWLQLNQAVPDIARGHCVITDFRVWMQTKYIRLIDQRQFVNVSCEQCISFVNHVPLTDALTTYQ